MKSPIITVKAKSMHGARSDIAAGDVLNNNIQYIAPDGSPYWRFFSDAEMGGTEEALCGMT